MGPPRLILPAILILSSPAMARAQEAGPEWFARMSLPRWVDSVVSPLLQEGRYSLGLTLNPFFQVGDFDRDQRLDAAVFVRSRREREIWGSDAPPGRPASSDSWGGNVLREWWRRLQLARYLAGQPGVRGDQLFVEKSESASGVITWDGRRYRWTQLGD